MAFQTRGLMKQIRDYIIKERIGVGSYGTIYKVMPKNSKQILVLKQIPFLTSESKEEIEEVKNEATILSQLNSRFVVKSFDSFEENNSLNIVMEYCEGGDLCSYLNTMKKYTKVLNENQIWKFFIQLSLGLDYIHKRKILHRDLKTMNIFLTKELDIKIGDLGVAKRLLNTARAYTFIGTPFYLSPEICEEKPYNEKSDVWALGCILYEMTTFKHPFNATNQAALFIKILNGTYEPIVNKYSKELKKMIDMLLEKDYFKRPSIRQVIETPLFLSKAKALGMLDIVIDALSFFNHNNANGNSKIKMIKISSIQKLKAKGKANIKTNVRKRKKEKSLKGGSLSQSETENQNACNKANISNSSNIRDLNKAIGKQLNINGGGELPNKNQGFISEKQKLFLPKQNNNNIVGKNHQVKSNQIQFKKPITNIVHYDSGIMKKLSQISNDYSKLKEEDYNNLISSRKKDSRKQSNNDKEKFNQQQNNSNKKAPNSLPKNN